MNLFQFMGDLLHLGSIFVLLIKITKTRSAAGISFKTQALYALVFCTRYLDLFTNFHSLYLTVMKIFFIGSALYILYLMNLKFRATWDPNLDTLRVEFLIIPCAVLTLIWHEEFSITELAWVFSIYLEAVAILPQLFQMSRTGEAETITAHYIFALGAYRACYLLKWMYRAVVGGQLHTISVFAGLIQTALYCDFFYVYFKKVLKGQRFVLPA